MAIEEAPKGEQEVWAGGLTTSLDLCRTKKKGMQPEKKVRLEGVRGNRQNYFLSVSTQKNNQGND